MATEKQRAAASMRYLHFCEQIERMEVYGREVLPKLNHSPALD